jgi:hypothetical protein
MSIPKDYKELLQSIAGMTDDGRVKWKSDGHSVELKLENDRLFLWAGTDERTEDGFVSFALRDLSGNTLDTWYVDAGSVDYDFMNRLYLAAKRLALGIPSRLASIRESIAKSKTLGE